VAADSHIYVSKPSGQIEVVIHSFKTFESGPSQGRIADRGQVTCHNGHECVNADKLGVKRTS
jgi:hypothetical protein